MERRQQEQVKEQVQEPVQDQVVVTGLGAVSGWGWGVEALWQGLRSGVACIGDFDRFEHSRHRTHIASQVPPPPDEATAPFPDWESLSMADRFAVAAAAEALAHAGLSPLPADLLTGVYFGSCTGAMLESEAVFMSLLAASGRRVRTIASQEYNGPADAVARSFGCAGGVETVSSACASGGLALGGALDALRSGMVDVALAGGADALCRLTYAGFNALRAVDPRPCQPFRAERAGMSMGEGAAVLVLERRSAARARGATVFAELAGIGASCDAYHMTAPQPNGEGPARAIRVALEDAGATADEIDFINAHGTGTPHNDAAEWKAVEAVFGSRAAALPITSTKGSVGHLLGSAGAIEALATVLCLQAGEVHPTPGEGEADAQMGARLVVGQPLALPAVRAAVSTSMAFGGANAALVLRRGEAA